VIEFQADEHEEFARLPENSTPGTQVMILSAACYKFSDDVSSSTNTSV